MYVEMVKEIYNILSMMFYKMLIITLVLPLTDGIVFLDDELPPSYRIKVLTQDKVLELSFSTGYSMKPIPTTTNSLYSWEGSSHEITNVSLY